MPPVTSVKFRMTCTSGKAHAGWRALLASSLAFSLGLDASATAHLRHRHAVAATRQARTASGGTAVAAAAPLSAHPHAVHHVGGRDIEAVVTSWANRGELAHSLVGVDIIDLASGQEIVNYNGRKRFTPASTAKVFTTSCAYEKLGPNFVYKTCLGTRGEVDGHRVKGDLLLIPSQDPTTDRDDLRSLFTNLRSKGISEVDGKLVFSDTPGGGQRFQGEWLSEDWSQDYMPVSSSLVLERNMSAPGVFSAGKYSIHPLPVIDNAQQRTLIESDLSNGWVHYNKDQKSVQVFVLNESKGAAAARAVANPDAFNFALAEESAKAVGIHFGNHSFGNHGEKSAEKNPQDSIQILASHDSEPLAKIIRHTLHVSDNLYAQQILRTIGSEAGSKYGGSLEEAGLVKMRAWLASIGVPVQEVVLWDGCGLSRKNFISPYSLNMVLRHMATTEAAYTGLLTPATIKPRGSFDFKTGSMDSVRGITGILETQDGKRLALTVLVNGHVPSVRDLRTSISILVSQIAQAQVDLPQPETTATDKEASKEPPPTKEEKSEE